MEETKEILQEDHKDLHAFSDEDSEPIPEFDKDSAGPPTVPEFDILYGIDDIQNDEELRKHYEKNSNSGKLGLAV